jgi:hypothetical protein
MAAELVEFDVDAAARLILDSTVAATLRALKLYELQLALLSCQRPALGEKGPTGKREGPPRSRGDSFTLWAPKWFLPRVAAYACTRLLQYLEEKQEKSSSEGSLLQRMAHDKDYAALHDLFSARGGWSSVRTTRSANRFQAVEVQSYRFEAAQTAKLIAFSLRFRPLPGRPKIAGGITIARTVLGALYDERPNKSSRRFRPERSAPTLTRYWTRHRYAPALIYLAYFERAKCLRPPDLRGSTFAAELLRLASDRDELVGCLSRHNAICTSLEGRRYKTQQIDVEELPTTALEQFEHLPKDVIELI